MITREQLTKEQLTQLRSISVVGELVKILGIGSIRCEGPLSLRMQLYALCIEVEDCSFITKPPIEERPAIASEFRQRLNAIIDCAGDAKSVCEDICVRYDRYIREGARFSQSHGIGPAHLYFGADVLPADESSDTAVQTVTPTE